MSTSSASPSREQREALLSAGRSIAAHVVTYPSEAVLGREIAFNHFAPFFKAPMAYGAGLVLLLMSLGANSGPNAKKGWIERGLYGAGMAGFVSGIGLEILGFYYRVRISGWAPVTNMYETVVWVALVTSVIGLVLEAIYRKTYAATAATGVALLATVLAANVSLLDPDIHNLQPVLRSNYWLTIHVLTIVSSYAAFALAMGLGMLAIGYYLSATYRREVSRSTLMRPSGPPFPALVIGTAGLIAPPGASPLALRDVERSPSGASGRWRWSACSGRSSPCSASSASCPAVLPHAPSPWVAFCSASAWQASSAPAPWNPPPGGPRRSACSCYRPWSPAWGSP